VAEPLERRLATIAGVTELTSTNYVGSSMVVVQFDLNATSTARRATWKRGFRGRAPTCRPRCATIPPTRIQSGGFAHPDSFVDVEHLDDGTALRSANTIIQQQLSQITGVGQITLGGSALPSVRVELEPDKLSSYGIGLEDVRAAIAAANADSAKGHVIRGISATR